MASFQVEATPAEDVITETEAASKAPQAVSPEEAEPVKIVDVEDDEEGYEEKLLAASPPYDDQKIENSDDEEEEKDVEYSPFVDDGDDAEEEMFRPAGESAAGFGDFSDDEV